MQSGGGNAVNAHGESRPVTSPKREGKAMKWKIYKLCNGKEEYVIIRADSFDEAIAKARKIDKAYCAGYVVNYERNASQRNISGVGENV